MASSHHVVDNAEGTNLNPQMSPRNLRRTWSSGSQKCVCAPATHIGSFKCRLHRTNSQGHSPRSDQMQQQQQQSANSNSPSHTVEAQ